jgi:hypothetical protein
MSEDGFMDRFEAQTISGSGLFSDKKNFFKVSVRMHFSPGFCLGEGYSAEKQLFCSAESQISRAPRGLLNSFYK